MKNFLFFREPKNLVVAVGPIGLAVVPEFANFETETLVADELSEINRVSKAICLSQRSLEMLNSASVAEQFIKKGSPMERSPKILEMTRAFGK